MHAHECLVHSERTLDRVAAEIGGRGREACADLLVFTGADARRGVVDAVFHRAARDRIPVVVRQEIVLAVAGAVVFQHHALGGGFLAHGGLRPVDELVEDLRAHGGGVLRVAERDAFLEHDLRLRARVDQRHGDVGVLTVHGEPDVVRADGDGFVPITVGPAAFKRRVAFAVWPELCLRRIGHGHVIDVRAGQDGGDDGCAQRVKVDLAGGGIGHVERVGAGRVLGRAGRRAQCGIRRGVGVGVRRHGGVSARRGVRRHGRGCGVRRGRSQLRERVDRARPLNAHGVALCGRFAVERGIARVEAVAEEASGGVKAVDRRPLDGVVRQDAGRAVLPLLAADLVIIAQQGLAEQVVDVCSGGDAGRAVVAGRHRTRGGDRQLECGELAEQQHGQQQGKDPGCVFAGYHCK